jgi:hypothetical protein
VIAQAVYILSGVLSVACALMLFRGYRRTASVLLLWSSMCFGLLAINNAILIVDLVIFPNMDINGLFWRNLVGARTNR